MSVVASKAKIGGKPKDHRAFDINAWEDEVRLELDGNFESVQFRETPVWSVKIGVEIPL